MSSRSAETSSRLEHLSPLDGLIFALAIGAIAAAGFNVIWVLVFVVAALAAAVARIALTVADARSLIAQFRGASRHDPLTGLGNRLALLEHIGQRHPTTDSPLMLAFFALEGLERHDERFGRLSRDALLQQLAHRLVSTVGNAGRAFRPSVDRFAVVEQVGRVGFAPLLSAATAALSEDSDGFCIDALAGVVLLPEEAATGVAALALVEHRLAMALRLGDSDPRPSLQRLVTEAVQRHREAITEGSPTLAHLARATASRLGLDPRQTARAALAAELYDIGDLAVPREILARPQAGDDISWEFLEHHSVVGERIIESAIEAPDVASVIRASHEHYDGSGEPAGLAGNDIPIEARIATVCAAFEAMLSPHRHHPARSSDEALREIRGTAGSQFDPDVVRAFSFAVAEARSAPARR